MRTTMNHHHLLRRCGVLQTRETKRWILSASLRSLSTVGEAEHCDVCIVGGGVVGSTLAKLLSQEAPALSVRLLEGRSSVSIPSTSNVPSARSYALSPKSLNMLKPLDLPRGIYNRMQVWESNGPAILTFTSEDVEHSDILGAVVEDEALVSHLWKYLEQQDDSILHHNVIINSIETPQKNDSLVKVVYNQNDKQHSLQCNLLVAADGVNSFVRRTLGMSVASMGYDRRAATCVVELDSAMPPTAFQRFLPSGPLALLPSYDSRYATIVWSTTPHHAKQLQNMSPEELSREINNVLQHGPQRAAPSLLSEEFKQSLPQFLQNINYGSERFMESVHAGLVLNQTFSLPPKVSNVIGRVFSFDLQCMQARRYVQSRVALIGDAAHAIHPLAGQGLNLGLGDVQNLVRQLVESHTSGMDVGNAMHLQRYQSERQKEVSVSMAGIHALHSVFSLERAVPLIHARSLGMNLINNVAPVRSKLAAIATGSS